MDPLFQHTGYGGEMNFLAHTLLAFDEPELLVGQFCGDFVRGRDLTRFPLRIAQGIRLHRHVDVFTDSHEAVVSARASFATRRRFAGIIMDVWFDHCLARDWQRFNGLSLDSHAHIVSTVLADHDATLPVSARRFAGYLQREAVFQSYRSPAAVVDTLSRLAKRSRAMQPLAMRLQDLSDHQAEMDAAFEALWPELQQSALLFAGNGPAASKSAQEH